MTDELHYERGAAAPQDLEAFAREVWEEASAAGELHAEIRDGDFPYEIGVSGSGIVVSGTALVVGFASTQLGPVAKRVALDVWKDLLLPKLKRRFGEDKIGKQRRAGAGERSAETGRPKEKRSGKAARTEPASK